jgi:predicted porin
VTARTRRACTIAIAMAVAAPLAASAQGGSSTLYGGVNLDLEYVTAEGATGGTDGKLRLSSNSSRFGFRGAEYVGGGLVAVWQIESAFNADAGGGGIALRDTYVGVDGDWGTFKAGYFLSPYDDMQPIFGNVPTLTTSILSTAAIWAQGGLSKSLGGFDARLPNSLRYDSPDWDGWSGSAQVSLGEDNRRSAVWGAGMLYGGDRLDAGVAWEHNKDVRGPDLDDDALTVAAAWNFGAVRVAGAYEYLRYETPVGTLRRNFWAASGTIVSGPGTIYLFAGYAGNGRAPAPVRVGGLASGPDTSAWQYEASYTYSLSSRTMAYAGYVRIDNEANAAYNFYVNPFTPQSAAGLRLSGYVLGMAHFF